MSKLSRFILVIICCSVLNGYGQDIIKVEIQDSESLEPLSFATIRFKGTNRGLVADYNGQFRLPYKVISDLPILVISYLGYLEIEVDSKTLSKTELNSIKLFPQSEALEEVVLHSTNNPSRSELASDLITIGERMLAIDIVRKAVLAIPFNLDNKPHSHVGYYRDYQIVDDTYYNLKEGIIEQYDNGINSLKIVDSLNQSVVYSFKKNSDFKTDNQYTIAYDGRTKFVENAQIISYGGNELTLLNVHDAIRNYTINSYSFVYKMTKEFLNNHKFSKGEINFNDDEPIIEINLEGISEKVGSIYNIQGKIFISLKDYAIRSFSYTVYDYNKSNPLLSIDTEYRRQDDKMYLNYIAFNNRFVVADKKVFKDSLVTYNKESNSFNVIFNNRLNLETVQKRDFKIRLKGRKVYVKKMEISSPNSVELKVAEFDDEIQSITSSEMTNLEFQIKNIADIDNRNIYQTRRKIGYQFREYFIQEVFTNKILSNRFQYMPKNLPLDDAPINRNVDTDGYIINSPLMQRRTKTKN